MLVASLTLLVIGVVAFGQAFEFVSGMPIWWREFSAVLFRAWLFFSVIMIFRSWKNIS